VEVNHGTSHPCRLLCTIAIERRRFSSDGSDVRIGVFETRGCREDVELTDDMDLYAAPRGCFLEMGDHRV
jgi:hypothetical protein